MFDDFYGLRGQAFQLTPDPAFYFESLTHRKALSYLSYGLAQGEGFIVVTGEVGAGKSTLAAHLMATIDRQRLTAAQVITSRFAGDDMIYVVALAFGLQVVQGDTLSDKSLVLNAIEDFLHGEARAGRRCLLVVDEVQNLSGEALDELRMLSNFQLGAHPLLQILLLGQPEFRDSLHNDPRLEPLRQRVIAAHHLEAMQPDEIQPYVLHRLKLVGWVGNPSFDSDIFARLYEVTGGVPRRINQVAGRLLLFGAIEQRQRIDAAMLAQVLSEIVADGGLFLASGSRPAPPQAAPAPAALRPVPAPAPVSAHAPAALRPVPVPAPAPVAAMPAPLPSPEPSPSSASPTYISPPSRPAGLAPAGMTADTQDMFEAFAQHEVQIAELQQAVVELAHSSGLVGANERNERNEHHAYAGMEERLARIEDRLVEQEGMLRHTLTMLIEWVERDAASRYAA